MNSPEKESFFNPRQSNLNQTVFFILLACLIFALVLFLTRPIAHGYRYDLVLKLTIELLLVWLIFSSDPGWLSKRGIIIVILIAGLALAFYQLSTINPEAEVIESYNTVFKDLEEGRNPYTSGRIYHRDESGQVVYQNFNYFPLELYPYWFFYRVFKVWNMQALSLLLISLQFLAVLIMVLTFRKIKKSYFLVFLPLIVFSEIKTTAAMTMLMLAIFVALLFAQERTPSTPKRLLLAVVIGLGLLTKFLFIPIAAVYYLQRLDFRSWKNFFQVFSEGLVSIAVALSLMVPFGLSNVIKSTILFNLNLGERNLYTTFYPNILSGVFYLIKLPELYPVAAVVIMIAVVLAVVGLPIFTGIMISIITFLLVSPTPEPQYFGTVLLLALAAKMRELYWQKEIVLLA
ncbi:MAG: hypothetical protein RBR88_02920 [Candidatus Saccharicenans sp.]|nr:hypothetical protein [Candidatus Saccharicenans sp.]